MTLGDATAQAGPDTAEETGGSLAQGEAGAPGPVSLAAPALAFANPYGERVRPMDLGDLPEIATLFLRTFRPRTPTGRRQRAIDEIVAYMRQIYLEGPCSDDGINALVHVGQTGAIGGFLGLIKSSYLLDGRVLRTCASSALMAAGDAAHRRVGPQLMRALTYTAFDLYLTDSANRTSFAFARPMRYEIALLNSLEWSRPFRPAAMLVDMARRRWPLAPSAVMAPLARLADLATVRVLRDKRRRSGPRRWVASDLDADGFAEHAPRFLDGFRLRPAWTDRELPWLLRQAAQQRSSGPLRFRLVTDNAGAAIGCFAFYGAPGRSATVLHLLAGEAHWDSVVACLMEATEQMGCIGVHGAAHAKLMPHLYTYPDLFFYHAGATMAYARDPAILEAIRTERALLGGLAGDRWTRLSKDAFGLTP